MDRAEVSGCQYIMNYIKYRGTIRAFLLAETDFGLERWTLRFLLPHLYFQIPMRHKMSQHAKIVGLFD